MRSRNILNSRSLSEREPCDNALLAGPFISRVADTAGVFSFGAAGLGQPGQLLGRQNLVDGQQDLHEELRKERSRLERRIEVEEGNLEKMYQLESDLREIGEAVRRLPN